MSAEKDTRLGVPDATADWAAWSRAWGGLLALAFANAAARGVYAKALGERRAQQVSSVTLLAAFAPWVRRTERAHPLPTLRDALLVGAGWGSATVAFEFGFGHFVARESWSCLLDAYDVTEGRLWPVDVAAIVAAPAMARAARLRHADRSTARPGR